MLHIFPKLLKQFPFPPRPLSSSQRVPTRRRLLPLRLLMASPTQGDAPLAAPAPAADATDAAFAAAAAVPDPGAEFGFQRPELGKEKLVGTVGFHERHVFLCYKGPDLWPSHLEASESDRLPRLLAAAIKARKPNLKKTIKLTICEGEDGTESSNGDVLIFPDMIRYKGLTHFDVDNFVEEVLVKDIDWLPRSPEPMSGSYIFVCSHGSRDKRCGVCGPALIKRFKEEINELGLDDQVAVSACSHVGGHKYAGNVIIFSSDAKGEVTGHWYGYVVPDDVPVLLHKHIGQGEVVDHLWRGQMGLSNMGDPGRGDQNNSLSGDGDGYIYLMLNKKRQAIGFLAPGNPEMAQLRAVAHAAARALVTDVAACARPASSTRVQHARSGHSIRIRPVQRTTAATLQVKSYTIQV
ncbi:hypothetical protein ACJX0J_021258 [Zea mays]